MLDSSRFNNNLIESRQVRIFLSSTFSDMQVERTELVKVFEILKVEAAKRNVALSVVDLRWGVTEEEARSGKVISVCLEEIEHSHPFFIGILGSNYGTAPKREELKKNLELLERYDWLNDAISDNEEKGMSITEMEIQYGVLKNNKKDIDAAFYFKKSDTPDNSKRLTKLKGEIRDYCRSKGREDLPKEYSGVSELCDYVMEEVRNVINKHFPETNEVTLLDRERSAQKAYINSRHSNYYERPSYFEIIDKFIRNDNHQHLVFTGASGIGKSALLANWILKNEKNSKFNLIHYFVGNSFSGNNYESILRHICDEIYDLYDIRKDDNLKEKIEEEAQRLVAEVSQRDRQLIIVIDGINQIVTQGPGKEKLLLWLPSVNKGVKYIFSTLPDDETMKTFNRLDYDCEIIHPLSSDDLKEWIPTYLKRVGKSLDKDKQQLERIIGWILGNSIQGNMLVLKTLLDELTRFGVYEKVDEQISLYTSSTSISDFFDKVLVCLEKDYSLEKDLVKRALILIAVSEHGLSEDEMMTLLGCQRRPLEWKLFFCAFYNHFVEKEGLITFSHQYVMDAVKSRYVLDNAKISASYRQEIVDHFAENLSNDEMQRYRSISELAHQYFYLSDWRNLHKTLLSFEAFAFFDSINEFLLAKYWRALLKEGNGCYRLSDYLYISERNDDLDFIMLLYGIGFFVSNYFAEFDTALDYNLKAISIIEKNYDSEHPLTMFLYNNVGGVYWNQGNYDKALEYMFKAIEIQEKVFGTDNPITAFSYNNVGAIYDKLGRYEEALDCYFQALEIRENTLGTEHHETAVSYSNIGGVFSMQGDYNKALMCYFKALEIQVKVLGTKHPAVAISYNNIGLLYDNSGDYVNAMEYYNKALAIEENVFGTENPATAMTLNNIGGVYWKQGDYLQALEYHTKALEIQEKMLGVKSPDTAQSYNNVGSVYWKQGEYDNALKYFFKALAIQKMVYGKDHPDIARSYNNIGENYCCKKDYENAMKYCLMALTIQERILGKEHPDTAETYHNIGSVYLEQGDYVKAFEYLEKAFSIYLSVYGLMHPSTMNTLRGLNIIKDALGINI